MTGNSLNRILNLGGNHALYSEKGIWYHNLKKFPGILFDYQGYLIFESAEAYQNNPFLTIRQDLNIKSGIQSLAGYKKFDLKQISVITGTFNKLACEDTLRRIREVEFIIRNRSLVNEIKKLYNNTCQICDTQLKVGPKSYYSEVHHIKALGKPHNGRDRLSNMICVCPNCHILLDLKALKITVSGLKKNLHNVDLDSITYHNRLVSSR